MAETEKIDSLLRVFLWGQAFQLDQEFPVKDKQLDKRPGSAWLNTLKPLD